MRIPDYWHVLQRPYEVAEAHFGSRSSEEAKRWGTMMRGLLENNFVHLVAQDIKDRQPRLVKQRNLRDDQAGLLERNQERLQYGSMKSACTGGSIPRKGCWRSGLPRRPQPVGSGSKALCAITPHGKAQVQLTVRKDLPAPPLTLAAALALCRRQAGLT